MKYDVNAYMTLNEVGAELGISGEAVRQAEARALKKIHKYLLNRFGQSVTIWDILPLLDKETHYVKMSRM
jgi:hypothetical protein